MELHLISLEEGFFVISEDVFVKLSGVLDIFKGMLNLYYDNKTAKLGYAYIYAEISIVKQSKQLISIAQCNCTNMSYYCLQNLSLQSTGKYSYFLQLKDTRSLSVKNKAVLRNRFLKLFDIGHLGPQNLSYLVNCLYYLIYCYTSFIGDEAHSILVLTST